MWHAWEKEQKYTDQAKHREKDFLGRWQKHYRSSCIETGYWRACVLEKGILGGWESLAILWSFSKSKNHSVSRKWIVQ